MQRLFQHSFLTYLLCFLLLSGCASQQAQTLHGNGYDFSKVNSYSLYERNSVFAEQQNIHYRLRNLLELVIEQNFEQHGYHYKPVKNADVIVSYQLTGIALVKSLKSQKEESLCPLCMADTKPSDQREQGGREMRPRTRDELTLRAANKDQKLGDLLIDIIDTNTMRSVWRGQYPLDIGDKDNSQEVEEEIRFAMDKIMTAMLNPNH